MPQGDEVGEGFFAALAHVRQIHANCKALLRTHHQRAGAWLSNGGAALVVQPAPLSCAGAVRDAAPRCCTPSKLQTRASLGAPS